MSNNTKRRSFRRPKLTRSQRLRKRAASQRRLESRRAHDPDFVQEEILEEKVKALRYKNQVEEQNSKGLSPTGRRLTPGADLLKSLFPESMQGDEEALMVAEVEGKQILEGRPLADIDYEGLEKRILAATLESQDSGDSLLEEAVTGFLKSS